MARLWADLVTLLHQPVFKHPGVYRMDGKEWERVCNDFRVVRRQDPPPSSVLLDVREVAISPSYPQEITKPTPEVVVIDSDAEEAGEQSPKTSRGRTTVIYRAVSMQHLLRCPLAYCLTSVRTPYHPPYLQELHNPARETDELRRDDDDDDDDPRQQSPTCSRGPTEVIETGCLYATPPARNAAIA